MVFPKYLNSQLLKNNTYSSKICWYITNSMIRSMRYLKWFQIKFLVVNAIVIEKFAICDWKICYLWLEKNFCWNLLIHPKHYYKEYGVLEMVKIKFLEVNAVIMEKYLLFLMVKFIYFDIITLDIFLESWR